jgi:hypothetical protein
MSEEQPKQSFKPIKPEVFWKQFVAPLLEKKIHIVFGPYIFQVCYENPGQRRISLEVIGIAGPDPPEGVTTMVKEFMFASGERVPFSEAQDIIRKKWPQKHEVGRNPDNVTLGVQDGVVGSKASFKKPGGVK